MTRSATRRAARHARRGRVGLALGAAAAGSLVLALSMGTSLAAFTATINNTTNTATTASLAISETTGSGANLVTCNSYDSTASCSTINKYGGSSAPLSPGGSQTQTITLTNKGTAPVVSSSLTPGACSSVSTAGTGSTTPPATNTDPANLCSVMNITVYKGATTTTAIYTGSAANFTAAITTLGTLAPGASQLYTFVVSLPSTATSVVQGQTISQSLLWTFNA